MGIHGSYDTAAAQAALVVGSPAPGVLGFNLDLDGDALLQYASGEIGAIAGGVSLTLVGSQAHIADAGTITTNSALTGLSQIAGTLKLLNGASVAVGGNLLNTGAVDIDSDAFTTEGGSGFSVGGTDQH